LTTALLLLQWQRSTIEVLLFPQPTEHVAHHRRCRQPQLLLSGNRNSSLPSQHKADCCVEQDQNFDKLLIGLLLLYVVVFVVVASLPALPE
jgi:hypothetical protein